MKWGYFVVSLRLLAYPNLHVGYRTQNLTIWMQIRRLTRLDQCVFQKLENHKAAVALHVAYTTFAGCTDHSGSGRRWGAENANRV